MLKYIGKRLLQLIPVPVSYTHLAGATTSILAEKYGVDSPFATKMVIFSTLLSLPTICLWSMVL